MPTLTVSIYGRGAPLSDGSSSMAGHMFYTVEDNGVKSTYGFNPANPPSGYGPGHVTTDDASHYLGAPFFEKQIDVSDDRFRILKAFGDQAVANPGGLVDVDGTIFNQHYNAFTNSCIDFTMSALGAAGLNPYGLLSSMWPTTNSELIGDLLGGTSKPPENLGNPSGDYFGYGGAAGSAEAISGSTSRISPLVVALGDNRMSFSKLDSLSPSFDLQGSGFKRQTGWIGPNTGLLALDRNGDGQINDITELFGQSGTFADGFAALRTLDTNADGTIDARDAQFGQLRVWVDANGDAVTQTGELKTLAELGIASIGLAATASTQVVAGNAVKLTGSYTLTNGTQRTLADVWFTNSPTYTRPTTAVTLDTAAAALPFLHGYGLLRDDLESAMLDPALKAQLQSIVASIGQDPAGTLAAIRAMMLQWSHSTGIDPASRGGFVGAGDAPFDARQLDFLEKYTGVPFFNTTYGAASLRWNAAIAATKAWVAAYDGIVARTVLQAGAQVVPEFRFDPAIDFVLPGTTLDASLTAVQARLGPLAPSNRAAWELALRVADAFRMDARIDMPTFLAHVAAQTSSSVAAFAAATLAGVAYADVAGGHAIQGTTANTTLYAAPDVREISILGGQTADPPALDDTIVYARGSGALTVNVFDIAAAANSRIAFGPGITAADVTARIDAAGTLVLDLGGGDVIRVVENTRDVVVSLGPLDVYDARFPRIARASFADGTVLTVQQLFARAAIGTAGDDVLYGTAGADLFDGHGGADVLHGEGGADVFVYNLGYGHLEIEEDSGRDVNASTLRLGPGIDPATVRARVDQYGNVILGEGASTVTLDTMALGASRGVATVTFANGVVATRADVLARAASGTSGADELFGGTSVTFDGHGGDDILHGRGGGDIFVFEAGYGHLLIDEETVANEDSAAVLRLGPGIAAGALVARNTGAYDVTLSFAGHPGDAVVIQNLRYGSYLGHTSYGVATVATADGQVATRDDLLRAANAPNDGAVFPLVPRATQPDRIVLHVTEDAYLGDAQFTIAIDGQTLTGIQTVTATRTAQQLQDFTIGATLTPGPHTLAVTFINDASGGTEATDRNLFVASVDVNGAPVADSLRALTSAGTATVALPVQALLTPAPVVFSLSEDAYLGDAQAILRLDGQILGGGPQTVTASHALGQSTRLSFMAPVAAGPHTASVEFINDAGDGTPGADRNLYWGAVDVAGQHFEPGRTLASNGVQSLEIWVPASTSALTIAHGAPRAW